LELTIVFLGLRYYVVKIQVEIIRLMLFYDISNFDSDSSEFPKDKSNLIDRFYCLSRILRDLDRQQWDRNAMSLVDFQSTASNCYQVQSLIRQFQSKLDCTSI
jgi:hypothetical protein